MIRHLIFWQNIISPHQSSLLKALSEKEDITVTLVAEREIDDRRKQMGWTRPDVGRTQVIVAPTPEKIKSLLQSHHSETFHIFSGTRAYPMVWTAFKLAVQQNCRTAIIAEPGNWVGWKGHLRLLRSKVDALLLKNKISFLLANGHKAVEWYTRAGYPEEKIYEFGYFVDRPSPDVFQQPTKSGFEIIYVGRLSPEKGIHLLMDALATISLSFHLTLVGSGPLDGELKEKAKRIGLTNKITFIDFLPNEKVLKLISAADCLVLPSTGKDGWGVVVNESLMVGTPVVCSSNCGASVLLDSKSRGDVFNPADIDALIALLENRISIGKLSEEKRKNILLWTSRIEGTSAADYLLKIINFTTGVNSVRPIAPWKIE